MEASLKGIFSRERLVAPPGYTRWHALIGAFSLNLCIGQLYALSLFQGPLTTVLGKEPFTVLGWTPSHVLIMFTIAVLFLGTTTTIVSCGVEKLGPRTLMLASTCCFSGGLFLSSLGIHYHQLLLLYLGYGILGGIGVGLGYISNISSLIKWFPGRIGFATGVCLTGFGAGGMVAVQLSGLLMSHFKTSPTLGLGETFLLLGALYFITMLIATYSIREPRQAIGASQQEDAASDYCLTVSEATRTKSFYMIWVIGFATTLAGIGILGRAPSILVDIFQADYSAAEISGFVGFLSLSNMTGRLFWSYCSDFLGRKNTFTLLLSISVFLYASLFHTGEQGNLGFFVLQYTVLVSLYGGSFGTLPAYVADVFGAKYAGGIHSRLISFWSLAGLGSAGLLFWRHQLIAGGATPFEASGSIYDFITAILLLGLICNLFIKSTRPDFVNLVEEASDPAVPNVPVKVRSLIGISVVAGIPLIWAGSRTFHQAAEFEVTVKLVITVLPLLLGAGVCVACHYMDVSRFKVRGIVGDYFSSVALLFSLLASLLATEIWDKINRADSLLHDEVSALHSAISISKAIDAKDKRVVKASEDYWTAVVTSEQSVPPKDPSTFRDPLDRLYDRAVDDRFFKGNDTANSAFFDAVENIRSSRLERMNVMSQKMSVGKLISLMLLGMLTQVAIGLCHAGKPRALNTTVMLFSVAFALAVGILELLDGSYTLATTAQFFPD